MGVPLRSELWSEVSEKSSEPEHRSATALK